MILLTHLFPFLGVRHKIISLTPYQFIGVEKKVLIFRTLILCYLIKGLKNFFKKLFNLMAPVRLSRRDRRRGTVAKTLFLLLLFLMLCSGPATAGPRVLALQSVPLPPYEQALKGFEQAHGAAVPRLFLTDLKERDVPKTVREIQPDMVLAVGRDALLAARKIKTLPVVYCMVLNPPAFQVVEKNISGVSMNLPPEKQLGELTRVLPDVKSIGLLYDPGQSGDFVQGLREAAVRMGVKLTATAVQRSRDVPRLLNSMRGRIGVFWMLPDVTVTTPETVEALMLFSLENNTPVLTFSEKYLGLGATLSIGVDPFDIGFQAGELALKIFAGSDLKGLQHQDARKVVITVNERTAGKLGIEIDQKTIRTNRGIR